MYRHVLVYTSTYRYVPIYTRCTSGSLPTRYRVSGTRYRSSRPDIGDPISGHTRYRSTQLRYRRSRPDIGSTYRVSISKFTDIEDHALRYRSSISKHTDIEVPELRYRVMQLRYRVFWIYISYPISKVNFNLRYRRSSTSISKIYIVCNIGCHIRWYIGYYIVYYIGYYIGCYMQILRTFMGHPLPSSSRPLRAGAEEFQHPVPLIPATSFCAGPRLAPQKWHAERSFRTATSRY